jgi:hypothetical protein
MHDDNNNKVFAANLTKWLLLCAAAGFGSLFAYNILSPIHMLLGLVAALVVIGFNFAEGFLIRFAIAGWRFGFNRLALVSGLGVLLVATYSLMAGSSVIETMLAKNQELQLSAELQMRAAKTRIESAKADTLRVQMEARQTDKYGYLTSSAVAGAQSNELKIQAQEQEKMAEIMRNKSAAFTSPLFDASGVAFIMSLALEASIIGLAAFIELFLKPTPLPALIKFNDKLVDWSFNNDNLQNLNIIASPSHGTVGLPQPPVAPLPQLSATPLPRVRTQEGGGAQVRSDHFKKWLEALLSEEIKPTVKESKVYLRNRQGLNMEDAQIMATEYLDRAYNMGYLDYNDDKGAFASQYKLANKNLLEQGSV